MNVYNITSRVLLKFWLLPLVIAFLLIGFRRLFDLSLFLVLIIPFLLAFPPLSLIGLLIVTALKNQWLKVLLVLCVCIFTYFFYGQFRNWPAIAAWLQLQICKPYYSYEIHEVKQAKEKPRYLSWDWGESGSAIDNEFYKLVYDESDQTFSTVSSDPNTPSSSVKHLEGHFYFVVESY